MRFEPVSWCLSSWNDSNAVRPGFAEPHPTFRDSTNPAQTVRPEQGRGLRASSSCNAVLRRFNCARVAVENDTTIMRR